ncbi:MAG: hypothetical protein KDA37_01965 [Planctomycetales bacterium]|nr:hypothetical protein [Planctomycetales bacterium]
MTLTEEQLEWIVSEVVRRLRSSGSAPAATQSAPTTLALADRLVTLETLHGKLGGVTQLQVLSKAIVTPAVVDLLKERHIKLVRS